MNELKDRRVVVIGGGSGMGRAVAARAAKAGAEVVVAGRNEDRLQQAAGEIGDGVRPLALDMTVESRVRAFFQDLGAIDHLVIPGSSVRPGPLRELELADARATMESKFFGPYTCCKYARLAPEGSVVLFSGILSRRPGSGMPILAATNAAVETLGRALALELAPVRVNVISPGMTRDTGAYLGMPAGAREEMFRTMAERLPVKRVARPQDIAAMTLAVMTNPLVTGTVIDVDGGGLLV